MHPGDSVLPGKGSGCLVDVHVDESSLPVPRVNPNFQSCCVTVHAEILQRIEKSLEAGEAVVGENEGTKVNVVCVTNKLVGLVKVCSRVIG